ncbi:hypothetical protein BKG93_04655 [Rodentibacter ratti]|uniref:Uncharacterized protein n=1 Tax=Rodentibacter ratti TaxID=1906745 RepID=A0A1V3L6T3_9PAST|nr:hypothetical protein [Rodentibacter ratti]OOF85310.1 hypothetical protein BKG93_04655 [Rodentibacter ratti]
MNKYGKCIVAFLVICCGAYILYNQVMFTRPFIPTWQVIVIGLAFVIAGVISIFPNLQCNKSVEYIVRYFIFPVVVAGFINLVDLMVLELNLDKEYIPYLTVVLAAICNFLLDRITKE